MTDILTLVEDAIFSTLSGNAWVSALVGTRIFEDFAPADTADPLIIFRLLAGGDTNISPRRDVDAVYLIFGVATTRAQARQIAGAIDSALNRQNLTISGWSNYRCLATDLYRETEQISGKQRYKAGARYHISLDSNT